MDILIALSDSSSHFVYKSIVGFRSYINKDSLQAVCGNIFFLLCKCKMVLFVNTSLIF